MTNSVWLDLITGAGFTTNILFNPLKNNSMLLGMYTLPEDNNSF